MIGVCAIWFHRNHYRLRGYESGDVIDVSVCVIPSDPSTQLDHCFDAQEITECLLCRGPSEARVAGLDPGIEEALFGR